MKISVDFDKAVVEIEHEEQYSIYPLNTKEAFNLISKAWIRVGWDTKYVYSFTWMGRPIIQLPDDVFRIQEVIYQLKPDVIIETGVAHGGSLIFYASLCKAMDKGRVIGIDIEIREHNRKAIEEHELNKFITLLEGSSIDPIIVNKAKSLIKPDETVLVILDSNHSKEHVLSELIAYSPMVTPGSYIVATDGIMKDLIGAPRSHPDWEWNNPFEAAKEFLSKNSDFQMFIPEQPFNEGLIDNFCVTYWPDGWLKKIR